jgi:hypothetical protein
MKKSTVAAFAAFLISATAFADGFKVSGFLRAGLSSTFESTPVLNTQIWLPGIFFTGDSTSTRGRINLNFDGQNDNGNYGAFVRLQYSGASEGWGYGDVKYADAYVGLFKNVVTIAAGKIRDNWIISTGLEGYSVLDGNSGAAVTITPVQGLNITGAAVIDYSQNSTTKIYECNKDAFLGGVSYKTDAFNVMASYAGYGLGVANVSYSGIKDLTIAVEGEYETDHGMDELSKTSSVNTAKTIGSFKGISVQRMLADEWIQYKGLENWTVGLLSQQYLDKKAIAGDNDFTFTITPAAAYQLNSTVGFSLEGTYTQAIYDDAPKGYAVIIPAVKLSADKTASAYIWGSVSTDADQSKSCIGIGALKQF